LVVRRVLAAGLSVVFVAACTGDDDNDDAAPSDSTTTTSTAAVDVAAGVLTERECGYDPPLAGAHDCYFLEVPEDHAEPDGRTIRLAVTRLRATGRNPEPEPVVYLHGGPGGDATPSAANWFDEPFLRDHDIVLYDQRGSGRSEPSLECPEVDDVIRSGFESIEPYEAARAAQSAALEACRARLVEDGIDLDAYDSEASAADLEALRLALDVPRWNLLGISYGTRLALTYMRSYPDAVRSAVLDSVYPPHVGKATGIADSAARALQQLTDGCLADTACAAAYPDFATAIDRAFEQLNTEPYAGEVDLGADDGGTIALRIDGYDAIAGLFTALYDTALIPLLPGIIEDVAGGDYAIIPTIAQQGIPFATQFSDGAATSIDCADNAGIDSSADDDRLAEPGRYATLLVTSSNSYCDLWDVEPTSPAYNEPVTSELPVLVLAGRYDPVTPPADSRSTAQALPNATYVEADGIGHGVLYSGTPCFLDMYVTYLEAPSEPVDTSCGDEHPGPAFVTT
jgi:pimeloyl-ACP methyl ester carboxylesterase